MKKNVLLKVLILLIILAICLVAFVGIYNNNNTNIIPDYLLSMNLNGARQVKITPDTSTKEVVYDSEGNVSEEGKNEDGSLKEGYTKKDEKVNSDEVLTQENYKTTKKILENRLERLGVKEYNVRVNNDNGEIIVEIPENTSTDENVSSMTYAGKFEILDSETKEVLLDNSSVKEAKAVYGSTDSGTQVYLSIEFNKDGAKKLEEITKTYIQSKDEEGNTTSKKIKIQLDDESLLETYFGETITTGLLQLSVGSATTSSTDLASYLKQASSVSALIDNTKMPVKYSLADNTYFSVTSNENLEKTIAIIAISVTVIGLIALCIRYKANGVFASISFIGFIGAILLITRYANVIISAEAIISLIIVAVLNYILINYILKQIKQTELDVKESVSKGYLRYLSILFPVLIISVVFTFSEWTAISSIGMIMFWGLIIMYAYNYLILKPMLSKKQ